MKVDPRLIDVTLTEESGYPAEKQAEDTRDALMCAARDGGAAAYDFPDHLWIEPKDWPEVARLNDLHRTWPVDYLDRFTNQGAGNGGVSTHECTSHCFEACFSAARNRARQIAIGPPVPKVRLESSATSASVWPSCLSVYAEANPSEWGGANVRQIMRIAAERGILPDRIQPRDYGFRHTMQGTRGAGGINQSRGEFPGWRNGDFIRKPADWADDNWRETAKHFRVLEYIFLETWEQTVCLVLHGYAVGVGRSGHSVPYCKWIVEDNVMQYRDSYDVFRYDSIRSIQATVGGSYAIASTTVPDDWDHPAA